MKRKLTFHREEIVCYDMELASNNPSTGANVIVTFKDEKGNVWKCDKHIRIRLKKVNQSEEP